jgi:hypothetical protein
MAPTLTSALSPRKDSPAAPPSGDRVSDIGLAQGQPQSGVVVASRRIDERRRRGYRATDPWWD